MPVPSQGRPPPRRVRRYVVEGVRHLAHRLAGRSYLTYQASRYDKLWRAEPAHFSSADRGFQLDYCRSHGLRPSHRMLDLGCGPLAAGLHFIRYLDPGGYVGADISTTAIALARDAVAAAGVQDRHPTLVHLPVSAGLDPLLGYDFDLVWAQSVLTHMAPEDVAALIWTVPRLLRPGGQLLASCYLSDRPSHRIAFKDWGYDRGFLTRNADAAGLSCEVLDDFNHPSPYVPAGHRMVAIRLTRTDQGEASC